MSLPNKESLSILTSLLRAWLRALNSFHFQRAIFPPEYNIESDFLSSSDSLRLKTAESTDYSPSTPKGCM